MDPVYWLTQKHSGHYQQCAVAPRGCRDNEKAAESIKQQYIAVVKQRMKLRETGQQQHPPGESQTEIIATAACVAHLDVETEAEQKREGGIGFSCKQKPHGLHRVLIQRCQPVRLPFRNKEKIIMLYAVEHYYRQQCESAEGIHNVKALILLGHYHCA